MIDKSLATLPRRKTDGAIIIRSQDSDDGKARVFKLNANAGEPVLLERFVSILSHVKLHVLNVSPQARRPRTTVPFPLPTMYITNWWAWLLTGAYLLINDIAGYQSTPPPAKSGPFMYIAVGALTQMQGQVPQDAFDGEKGFKS